MRRHSWPDLDRPERRGPEHPRPPRVDERRPRAREPDPIARSLLFLQATAGNAAVAQALRTTGATGGTSAVVQRKPKGGTPQKKQKKPPAWLTDAQATLGQMFPNDPDMAKVVLKEYGDLNKVLQTIDLAAWTQSSTLIYVRSTEKFAKVDKSWPRMVMRYVLHHEAVHVRQFAKAKGPPSTWQRMLEFEKEAYQSDVTWLAGAEAAKMISDPKLLKELQASAADTLATVTDLLDDTKKLAGSAREDELYKRMKAKDLIPAGATKNPADLYKQPP